jgi:hypothetical protein
MITFRTTRVAPSRPMPGTQARTLLPTPRRRREREGYQSGPAQKATTCDYTEPATISPRRIVRRERRWLASPRIY